MGVFFILRPNATLSNTLRCGKSAYFWNTVFTLRLCGGTRLISSPAIITLPDVGTVKPAIILSSVVLPQPDGPRSVRNSPSRT